MAQSQQSTAGGSQATTRTAEPATTGSRTETATTTRAQPQGPNLTLTGAHDRSRGPRVRWDENVVDNEGMGKKSSKVCCIYHAPKAIDESSDESDSSSSSSSSSDGSDTDADEGASASRRGDADRIGKGKGKGAARGRRSKKGADVKKTRRPSPNAYEKVPKPKKDGPGAGGPV
ncbi:unnamed protein product [Discula destructiva]